MKVESVIISFIFSILCKLQDAYEKSFTHSLLEGFASKFKNFLEYSLIWRFIRKKGKIAQSWENSYTLGLLNKLINLPSSLLRRVYIKYQKIFDASIFIRVLKFFVSKYTLILGACLIITVIIPDSYWYNKYSVMMALVLVLLFLIKTILEDKQSFKIKTLELPIFIFWLSVILGTVNSVIPRLSLSYLLLYVISAIFLILIISSSSFFKELNIMVDLLLVGVTFTALYGIYQWKFIGIPVNPSITDTRLNPGLSRISSTMGNENVYGELLVLTLPFFVTAIINAKTLIKRLVFSAMIIPVVIALFLTGSRSAWISFAVSIFVFVFLINRKLLPLAILAGALAVPLLPDVIYRRIMTLFNPNENSLNYRSLIIRHVKPMLMDYWVSGVGLGINAFSSVFKRYLSFGLTSAVHTHNLYLQIWLEAGILSIASFIWFLFRLFKNSVTRIFKHVGQSDAKNTLIAGVSALFGILVMGLADHVWFYNRLMLMFWVVVGIILTCLNILGKEGEYSEGSHPQTNESN
ncbi:MAG TPA: hypothetical protein GXX20_04555 [Clostridiaceae bacterium]|nr:hypothetical protein [Clostridiaceae bacterium]